MINLDEKLILVGFDRARGESINGLAVLRQIGTGLVVINTFSGDEAEAIYNLLTQKSKTVSNAS